MNSVYHSCTIPSPLITPAHVYFFLLVASFLAFLWFGYKLQREMRSKWRVFLILSVFFIIFVIVAGISGLVIAILIDSENDPPSYAYHDLNAQIKNFCWLDKTRKYCPQNEAQVYIVAPKSVRESLQHAHVTYVYNRQTNQYTLLVRNNSSPDSAALFDSRLPYVSHYGYNTPGQKGVDFFDVTVMSNCDGSFRVTNPPPLPGPWKRIN